RLRRDIFRRSSIGLLMTARTSGRAESEENGAYGIDGTFGFFQSLTVNTYWARTEDRLSARRPANASRDSYRGQFYYNGDRYGLEMERLVVGNAFNPGVGYVRRTDMRR